MRAGKTIIIKSKTFKRIRINFRKFFYTILEEQWHHLMDQAELQRSVGNYLGVQKLQLKMDKVNTLLDRSICKCYDCNSFEKDRVFFSEESYYFMFYPPVDPEVMKPRTWWLCPECYEKRMEILKMYRKEKYYYFHEWALTTTLAQAGLESLEDYEKFNKLWDNNNEEKQDSPLQE